ncbi:hypothetical protein MPH_11012 [Macrophomina phaseolina MS6]|uniref:Uncharacterized protein n=1 Tax=Macrophomina phaseolina (strain MS6) TaxID=1126212 RepID=K2S566_MACPH|nr:hypothetical protein MPH_11012 [Macrophomina phaseolina MS6]
MRGEVAGDEEVEYYLRLSARNRHMGLIFLIRNRQSVGTRHQGMTVHLWFSFGARPQCLRPSFLRRPVVSIRQPVSQRSREETESHAETPLNPPRDTQPSARAVWSRILRAFHRAQSYLQSSHRPLQPATSNQRRQQPMTISAADTPQKAEPDRLLRKPRMS